MKTKTMALALLLLAGVSEAAMAQDRGGGREHQREQRMERREARQFRQDTPRGPEAREARRGPDGGGAGRQGGGERRRGGDRQSDPGRGGRPAEGRPDSRQGGDERRGEADRGGQRWERDRQVRGDQRPDVRPDVRPDARRDERRGEWRRDDDRSGWRREDPRRDDRRRDGRWDDGRRDGDRSGYFRRDGRDSPRWDARRYPRIYSSPHRYRVPAYRPPSGFYARSWGFGEVLPRGWYTPEYRLMDWWAYDLPMPPPGFSWVRVGPDVLLVDDFTGRVVQVVRYVFW